MHTINDNKLMMLLTQNEAQNPPTVWDTSTAHSKVPIRQNVVDVTQSGNLFLESEIYTPTNNQNSTYKHK